MTECTEYNVVLERTLTVNLVFVATSPSTPSFDWIFLQVLLFRGDPCVLKNEFSEASITKVSSSEDWCLWIASVAAFVNKCIFWTIIVASNRDDGDMTLLAPSLLHVLSLPQFSPLVLLMFLRVISHNLCEGEMRRWEAGFLQVPIRGGRMHPAGVAMSRVWLSCLQFNTHMLVWNCYKVICIPSHKYKFICTEKCTVWATT